MQQAQVGNLGVDRACQEETTGQEGLLSHRDHPLNFDMNVLVGRYREGRTTRVGGMAFGKGVRPIHGSPGFSLHWRWCWRRGGK